MYVIIKSTRYLLLKHLQSFTVMSVLFDNYGVIRLVILRLSHFLKPLGSQGLGKGITQ